MLGWILISNKQCNCANTECWLKTLDSCGAHPMKIAPHADARETGLFERNHQWLADRLTEQQFLHFAILTILLFGERIRALRHAKAGLTLSEIRSIKKLDGSNVSKMTKTVSKAFSSEFTDPEAWWLPPSILTCNCWNYRCFKYFIFVRNDAKLDEAMIMDQLL